MAADRVGPRAADRAQHLAPAPQPRRASTRRELAARRRSIHRADIEGLRGLSVLLVVAFHAAVPAVPGGFVGVDVFFVISGFLITGLLVDELRATGTLSLTAFYARRMRRLLPLACAVLVVTAVVFGVVLPPIDRPGLAADVTAAAVWSANWRFALGATDYMSAVEASPVLHYWSLSVEEQFYVLWPLLILALARLGGRPRHWSTMQRRLVAGLATVALGSLALSVLTTATTGPWAYFGLHARAWELAAGGLLALARPWVRILPRVVALPAGWLGLAAIVGAAGWFGRDTPFPGSAALLPVVGAVLVLAAGTCSRDGVGLLLSLGPLTWLGRISYAWYLWHWPCLAFATARFGTTGGSDGDVPVRVAGPAAVAGAVAVSLALAVVTHVVLEQPVRRAPRLLASRRLTMALGAATVATAVLVPVAIVGVPWSPSPVVDVAQAAGVEPDAAGPDPGGPALTMSAAAVVPAGVTGAQASTTPVAVSPGAMLAPGPRTLRMTPAQARADDTAPGNCFVGFGPTTVDPGCRFGDPAGERVVVLIGDSHAAQWYPALVRAATANHWTLYFWAKSACGYADTPQWISTYNRLYTECATWRARVLTRIAALGRVDAVVVGRAFSQLSKVSDAAGHRLTGPAASAAWATGARSVLDRLRSATGTVALLRDTPRPVFDAPACLSEHLTDPGRCDYPRAGHVGLDAALFAAEQPVVAGAGALVLDLGDLVCSTDPCPVVSTTGAIIFRDEHHLTATFARELGGAVAVRLRPLLAGAGG